MSDNDDGRIFVLAYPFEPGPQRGLLSPFGPGTTTLPAGHQIDPRFRPLPTDLVFEKDVAVTLRDGVTIYVDVFRPPGSDPVPVLVAWSPCGKSGGTAPSTIDIFDSLRHEPQELSTQA